MKTLTKILFTITLIAACTVCRGARAQSTYTAFLKYSYTSGMLKTCVYSSPLGDYSITLDAIDLCPLTLTIKE